MSKFLLTLLLLIGLTSPVLALDMRDFKTIPILEAGRIKPLDSFARASLKKSGGRDRVGQQSADEWLAEAIFAPSVSVTRPVFLISNVNTRHSLGLEDSKTGLYSFSDLVPGLKRTSPAVTALIKKEPKNLSRDEKDLLSIHDEALTYTSLLRSLSLLLPLDISLPEKYQIRNKAALSFLDLQKMEQDLGRDVQKLVATKGENIDGYTEDEKRTALLAFQLHFLASAAVGNATLKIIPPLWDTDAGAWHAPWELLQKGEGAPQSAELLNAWRAMGKAYAANDDGAWRTASAQALRLVGPSTNLWRLKLEVLQNRISPFLIATILYGLSFLTLLLFFVFERSVFYRLALASLCFGALVHLAGLSVRIILLMRPPVGTLYESLIFVSVVTVLISLIIEKSLKNGTGLLIGSVSGLALGLLSFSFAGDGDTLEMLTAVLNTNFWLATHVLCITMGYGWCILTAIFAHLYLAAPLFKMKKFQTDQAKFILHTLAILALLFTAIGTILGGIWADQSWGRFWGWDPKENGALLIVLWIIWLLHGKLGFQLKERGFLAGLAALNIIVALSWIGVNLLGVGLHSYGFTDGLFYGLMFFCGAEMALIYYLFQKYRGIDV